MKKIIVLLTLIFFIFPLNVFSSSENIILLHGLKRTKKAMSVLEKELKTSGYNVFNVNYPSTSKKIEELSIETIDPVLKKIRLENNEKINFITHSMGGIILRDYLSKKKIKNLGKVVMISPPNHGSEIVDTFGKLYIFKKIFGPSGTELGTSNHEFFKRIELKQELILGIITGNKSLNPLFSYLIPGGDDGKVSIESAKINGMTDFIVIPANHTFITRNKEALFQTKFFLKNAKFKKETN